MKKLIIKEELRNLLPSLSDEEYAALEASILKDGCLVPLIVWNGVLVDGHHRYFICRNHKIPFTVKNIEFENIAEAKLWIWKHQECRRSMTPFQRAEVALKLREVIEAKAKTNRNPEIATDKPSTESNKEAAEIVGVSATVLEKVEHITHHADDETIERLRRGEKGATIGGVYNRLKPAKINEVKVIPYVNARYRQPPVLLDGIEGTIKFREGISPEEVAAWLVSHFSFGILQRFILALTEGLGVKCEDNFQPKR